MSEQERFARLLGKLHKFAYEQGLEILQYQLFRTTEQQQALHRSGKSRCDGVRKISKHQLGLAVDIAVVRGGNVDWSDGPDYHKLAVYWKSIGGKWGGDFSTTAYNDIYHFEL